MSKVLSPIYILVLFSTSLAMANPLQPWMECSTQDQTQIKVQVTPTGTYIGSAISAKGKFLNFGILKYSRSQTNEQNVMTLQNEKSHIEVCLNCEATGGASSVQGTVSVPELEIQNESVSCQF